MTGPGPHGVASGRMAAGAAPSTFQPGAPVVRRGQAGRAGARRLRAGKKLMPVAGFGGTLA